MLIKKGHLWFICNVKVIPREYQHALVVADIDKKKIRSDNEAVSRKKDAHKAMCQNNTEESKRRYKNMKNEAKKAVSKAM